MKHLLTAAFLLFLVANGPGVAAASCDITFDVAVESYKHKQYDDAIKGFENCIAINPNDCSSFYYLGCCLVGLGKLEAADKAFSRCLKLHPTTIEAFYAAKSCREIEQRLNPTVSPVHLIASQRNDFERRRSSVEDKFQQSVVALKQRQRQKLESEAKSKIETLQRQINTLRADIARTVGDGHEYVYWRRGRRWSYPDVSYERGQVQNRIASLERQISEVRTEVRNSVERSDSMIDNTFSALSSQANATTGNIKPLLTSRSIYVRDYVHFTGDEAPPDFVVTPLKANKAGRYVGDGGAKTMMIANPSSCIANPPCKKFQVSKQ